MVCNQVTAVPGPPGWLPGREMLPAGYVAKELGPPGFSISLALVIERGG